MDATGQSSVGRLPLHQRGEVVTYAIVDWTDWEQLKQYRWYLMPNGYVTRHGKDHTGKWRALHLGRELLDLQYGDKREADHIDRDPLNNRRDNLRVVNRSQNAQNKGRQGGKSKYRGVTWAKHRRKWYAYGKVNGKMKNLGLYDNEEEAAAVASAWRAQHLPFSDDAKEQNLAWMEKAA